MNRFLREERGSALAMFALFMPIAILFAALALDVGNWFTHKRQLQNRADAAALAAGVEYARNDNLLACKTGGAAATTAATAIVNAAKTYAGDPNPAVTGIKRNTEVANQGSLNVAVNASAFGAADSTDGGNPCFSHAANASDFVSPGGGLWTDVKLKETNIPSFFGTFGINVPAVTARARVDIRSAGSINPNGPSIPFVGETGDFVPCAWAKFIDVATDNLVTLSGGQPNPLPLNAVGIPTDRTWEANVTGIPISSVGHDIAVRIVLGRPTSGACTNAPGANTAELPDPTDAGGDVLRGIDWINVYKALPAIDDGDEPAMNQAWLSPGSCGKVGYIYTTTTCTVVISASVDVNGEGGTQIYANDSNADSSGLVNGGVPLTNTGSGPGFKTWTGSLSLDPNHLVPNSANSQDYTDVGQHRFSFCFVKTSGPPLNNQPNGDTCNGISGRGKKITANGPDKNKFSCTAVDPCTGMVDTGDLANAPNNPPIATYLYDPVYSTPLVVAELEQQGTGDQPSIRDWYASTEGTIGNVKIRVQELGLDSKRTVVIHDSVQGSGNRTGAVDCGQGNGASKLKDAIETGCPELVQENWRVGSSGSTVRTYSCSPQDYPTSATFIHPDHLPSLNNGVVLNRLDCVGSVPGNKTGPIQAGMNDIIDCNQNPNYWDPVNNKISAADPDPQGDPRLRYVFLTTYGSLSGSGDFPVVGIAAFYITGWDGAPGACNGKNEKPPRDFTGKGTSIWGHYVNYGALSGTINPSSDPCDLNEAVPLCVPSLVR